MRKNDLYFFDRALKGAYFFHEETGKIFEMRLVHNGPIRTLDEQGHIIITSENHTIRAERLVWMIQNESLLPFDAEVMHKDGRKNFNAWSNLRLVRGVYRCNNSIEDNAELLYQKFLPSD